jgi:hypothetical protein
MKLFRSIQLMVAFLVGMSIPVATTASEIDILSLFTSKDVNASVKVTKIPDPIPVEGTPVTSKKLDKLGMELEQLSPEQYKTLLAIMHYGDEYELGMTLAAIAWKESGFGKFNMNLADGEYGSFGPFHIRLDYAAKRHGKKNDWSRSRLAERLLYDLEFAVKEAANVFKIFKDKKCNYSCALARYNGGYGASKNKVALAYAEDIKKRVKAIQEYIDRNYVLVKVDTINAFGAKSNQLALNKPQVDFVGE